MEKKSEGNDVEGNFQNYEIAFENKNPDALLQMYLKINENLKNFDLVANFSFEIFIKELNQNILITTSKNLSYDKDAIKTIDLKCNYQLVDEIGFLLFATLMG